MKITFLGTGNALTTKCYNTCFLLQENDDYFLVDGGGGNQILSQLEKINVDWKNIKNIFITHAHTDHILGIVWLVRMISQYMKNGKYTGEVRIYGASEVLKKLKTISKMLISEKEAEFFDKGIFFVGVKKDETINILNYRTTFFDILSTKSLQYGFCMEYKKNKKLVCCGDEPYTEAIKQYTLNSTYLMHEAFCLSSQADIFNPYEKHHSTVKDAAELAQRLNVKNLILYHTEDENILNRKKLYQSEGAKYYYGNLYIPNDLEVITLY